jgi:hypothetical protein
MIIEARVCLKSLPGEEGRREEENRTFTRMAGLKEWIRQIQRGGGEGERRG